MWTDKALEKENFISRGEISGEDGVPDLVMYTLVQGEYTFYRSVYVDKLLQQLRPHLKESGIELFNDIESTINQKNK